MKYVATAFTLTLGAWRLRISFDLEDAPSDIPVPAPRVPHHVARERSSQQF